MKYKVGDKVKVRSDLSHDKRYAMDGSNYSLPATHVMARYFAGCEMTVSSANDFGYLMEETGQDFTWTDEMLEEALPDFGLSVYRVGRSIIAENIFTGVKAVARCHPGDKFDPLVGADIAFRRLLGLPSVDRQKCMTELSDAVEHITKVYLEFVKGEQNEN